MSLTFSIVRPDSESASALIHELDEDLLKRYPGQWIHSLHPEDVINPKVIFVVGSLNMEPIACGALRPFEQGIAEVKRMFVKPAYRGRGYSRQVLSYLEAAALKSGYQTLRLETGTEQPEAVGLYRSSGYCTIPCFGEYIGNPFSLCFEKRLSGEQI